MATLRGWVYAVREHGSVVFVVLRTPFEKKQVVLKKGVFRDWGEIKKLHPETLVEFEGEWKEEPKVWGKELHATSMRIISPSKPLPFDFSGRGVEFPTRIRYRYLDIRRPEVQAIFRVRSTFLHAARTVLRERGFVEVQLPIIIATGTEGGAELFPLVYFGREAFLAQSGQLYKQSAVPAFERVFAIAPSFRAEKSRTRKHLTEFWQVDVEMAFATKEDLMELEFAIVKRGYEMVAEENEKELEILGVDLEIPRKYEKISYDRAIEILQDLGVDIEWGEDFGAPEERLLCRQFENPFFITEFPAKEVAFYYKLDDKNPEIAHRMDFMGPGEYGVEWSSGGPREERREILIQRMRERDMDPDNMKWYLDMFSYGFPPHGGFGMGVERVLQTMLRLEKIMEAALYPRTPDILAP